MTNTQADDTLSARRLASKHQRSGWYQLAVFLALGIVLEAMHGFKVISYLDNPIRRQQWTLAHAHGTLIALIHLAFASALFHQAFVSVKRMQLCSRLLMLTSFLLPTGFFLGGIGVTESDPGVGIWLVPPGGVIFLIAVVLIASNIQHQDITLDPSNDKPMEDGGL